MRPPPGGRPLRNTKTHARANARTVANPTCAATSSALAVVMRCRDFEKARPGRRHRGAGTQALPLPDGQVCRGQANVNGRGLAIIRGNSRPDFCMRVDRITWKSSSAAWICAALVVFLLGGWLWLGNAHAQAPMQIQGKLLNGTQGAPADSVADREVTLFQITERGPVTR